MLRVILAVAAAIRADLGRAPMGSLVRAYGESYWDLTRDEARSRTREV